MTDARFRLLVVVGALVLGCACASGGPSDTQAAIRMGDELTSQKRYAEAAEAYKLAVDLNPGDGVARAKLGNAYVLAGDPVRAADLMPDDVDTQLKAAEKMLDQTRFVDVEERMAAVLRNQPGKVSAIVLQACAIARMSNARWILFKLAEAVNQPERFAAMRGELRPKVPPATDAKAEELFRNALAADPENVDAMVALASFLWISGRPGVAEEWLRQATERQPLNDVTNYALGAYYQSVHRDGEALPYLQRAAAPSGMSSQNARFAVADMLIAADRAADGRTLLETMTAGDDMNGDVSVALAAIDSRAGKTADAVRRIDTLLVRLPNKPSALLLKAQILFALGNPDLRYARAAVAADPKSSEANALLGEQLISRGDVEGALAHYQDAARLNPDSPQASLTLARLLLQMGRGPEALIRAKDAVRFAPDDKDAVLTLVRALILKPDYAAAEKALDPMAARFPDDAEVSVLSGLLLTARGNEPAARSAFLRVLQKDASSTEALSGLVALDLTTRPSNDTQARVEAALKARPQDPELLFLAAQLYERTNDTTRAEAALRNAFEVDGANVRVGQALASLLQRNGRVEDAIGVLRKVLVRQPRARDVRIALALMLEDAGHVAEARTHYEEILGDNDAAPLVSLRLAALYLKEPDRLTQAFDLAMAAKRGLPDDPAASDVLGRAYTLKGLPDLAIAPLKEAVSAAPDSPLYHFHLGEAYRAAGNLAQARSEFAKALQIDGSFEGADRARQFVTRSR